MMPRIDVVENQGRLEFEAAALPEQERFPVWASAMPFYVVRTPDPRDFRASVRAWLLPPVIVVDATLSEIALIRDEERIRADGADDIVLQLLDGASMSGTADGAAFSAAPGEIVLHDRAMPLEAVLTAGRNVTVSMPRAFLDERLPAACVHGLVLGDGLARPLAAFLASLPDVLAGQEPDSGELARLLRDLVAAAIRRTAPPSADQPGDANLSLRARRYIHQNLSCALDVQTLCEALGVSRSRLYRAFDRAGGVARYVTAARLKRVHRLLTDPAERSTIAQLSAAHGFADSAHFSRLFRRTFGYGPQQLRRRKIDSVTPQQAPAPQPSAAPAMFNRWEAGRG